MNNPKKRKFKHLLVLVIIHTFNLFSYSQSCNKVIDINFNNWSNYKKYDLAAAITDFNGINSRGAGEYRGLDGNGKVWLQKNLIVDGTLRAEYLQNAFGGPNGGFLFDKNIPDSEEATLEYRVKFGSNFYWAAGGKLPGLAGGTLTGLGTLPDGCTDDLTKIENGFSARIMWRPLSSSQYGGPEGRLVVYTYFPNRNLNDPTQRCGVDLPNSDVQQIKITSNRWYTVKQHLKLNTLGQSNGIIELYLDGNLVYKSTNNLFRNANKPNVKINSAMFQSYRGGSDARFNSPRTENIFFDDIKVWVNCSSNTPTNPSSIVGKTINLKASNNKFVTSSNGTNSMFCDRTTALEWEKFTVIEVDGGKVALKGSNEKYVSSENGTLPITCNRSSIGPWEKFDILLLSNSKIALKGSNGKFISSEDGVIAMTCNRESIGLWESFNWVNLSTNRITENASQMGKTSIETAILYPNPTSGLFTIELPEHSSLSIFDFFGTKIIEKEDASQLNNFDFSDKKSGVYFVKITTNGLTTFKKLILE